MIGLNPSTADDEYDDPTCRRLMALLRYAGFGGFFLVNLLPDAASDPRRVRWSNRRFSARNRSAIEIAIGQSDAGIVAWGAWGVRLPFRAQVLELVQHPLCFGLTKSGEPKHPLYLSAKTELQAY